MPGRRLGGSSGEYEARSVFRLAFDASHLDNCLPASLEVLPLVDSALLIEWRPFFLMVAGASASLAGLLFVGLSLHVRHITTLPLYRYRARLSLTAIMLILIIASVVIVPRQSAQQLALTEAFPLTATIIMLGAGLVELGRLNDGARRPYVIRTIIALGISLVLVVGDVLIAMDRAAGVQILALCCLVFLAWMLFNAWALVIGLADETTGQELRQPR